MTSQTTSPSGEMPEPPSAEEIAEWADGIVYSRAPDGTAIYFDPDKRVWMRAPWRENGTAYTLPVRSPVAT